MKKNSLGRIGFVFKGTYNNENEYTPMDVVYYNGSSYICTNPTRDNLPTDNNYWNILVKSVNEEVFNSLKNRIIDLESELPDKKVEGSNIEIKDSAQARASILPLGNTEQESREGYNELNLANVEIKTLQGITSTYNSGNNSVTFNGTCTTDNTIFNILNNPISAVQNKTRLVIKYVSGTITGTGSNAFRLFDTNWDKSMSVNLLNLSSTNREIVSLFTHTDLVLSNNSFRFDSGTVLDNFTVQVMVYTSDEEKEYEQYGAMPSINYPSPIKVVEGSFESYNICNAPYTKDNKLTITATKDDYYEFPDYYAEMEAGKTYTLSFESDGTYGLNSGTDTIQVFWLLDKQYTNQYQMTGFKNTFTPTVSGKYYLRCDVNKNGTTHGFWNFMVYEGKEDKPYLPYGTIKNTYETKIQNKNLFSFDKAIVKSNSGVTATLGENKFTMVGTAGWGNYYVCFKNPKKNSDIAISADFLETILASKKGISIYGNNVDYISNLQVITTGYIDLSLNVKTRIKTIGNTGDYEYIWFRFWNNGTGTALTKESNCIVDNIQLELGNTATDYVEHQEQVKNLDFPEGIKLTDKDYIYKKDNKWFKYKGKEKIVLNGSESWKSTTAYEGYYRYVMSIPNLTGVTAYINGINTHFKQRTTQAHGGYEYLYVQRMPDTGLIYVQVKDFATLDDFKAWLSQNNVTVYYDLINPLEEEITDETFISQLEDLLNSETYKGVTHITTSKGSAEVADLILKVDYKQSNNSRIDALEKAILSLGGNI